MCGGGGGILLQKNGDWQYLGVDMCLNMFVSENV